MHKRLSQSGFTIVELLVVIVVIGILAVLVVGGYSTLSQRATTSSLQADLNGGKKQIENFYAVSGVYPTANNCTNTLTTEVCLKPSTGNTLTYATASFNGQTTYSLTAARGTTSNTVTGGVIPGIVTDGLVLNLDAGNPASYPGTGTAWTDLSGNGNNGTLVNGPAYSSADGGSIILNGSNQYINLNFPFTQSSSANSYTVFIGAKLSSTSSTRRQVWSSDNGGYDWSFGVGDGNAFTLFSGANIHLGRAQDTSWHTLTAQWSSTFGSRLYIDNTLNISTATIDYDSSIASTTSIGRNPSNIEYWPGNISFVLLYNRDLSQAEITQNFYAVRSRFGI